MAETKTVLMGTGNTIIPLTVSSPVSNPANPYMGKIPGAINNDKAVVLQGIVSLTAKRFVINFRTGPSASEDITLQYCPRFGEYTSLNSCKGESWGSEIKIQSIPFTVGRAFNILVVINSVGYEVYVNGALHALLSHRFPLDKVPSLDVHGDISLLLLGFIDNWSTSSSCAELKTAQITLGSSPSFTCLPTEISNPVIYPSIPHVFTNPVGLHQDKAMFFQGTLPADSTGFTVEFRLGRVHGDDVAFHYSPNIGTYTSLKIFKDLQWQTDEVVTDKPYIKRGPFLLIIGINSEGYQVFVNGLRHAMLKHFIPVDKVTTISVKGNLTKLICGFINNWSISSIFKELEKFTVLETLSTISQFRPFQISNPYTIKGLPNLSRLMTGIKQDTAFFYQGSISPDGNSFTINLKVGGFEGSDIAFHYNVVIGETTTLNSVFDGQWQTKETAPVKPFIKGGVFQMLIVIKSDCYEVYVNGIRHCTFKHRIPIAKVTAIEIRGDVPQLFCGMINNWNTSLVSLELQKIAIARSIFAISDSITFQMSQFLIQKPAIPYLGNIPGGLKKDMAVVIHGSIPSVDKGFSLNLKEGMSESNDIAFHFNPRIGSNIMMNSLKSGTWGTQETKVYNPFTKGFDFQMIIVVSSYGFEMYLNGKSQYIFKHRLPVEKVSTIYVEGEIVVQCLAYVDNWTTY